MEEEERLGFWMWGRTSVKPIIKCRNVREIHARRDGKFPLLIGVISSTENVVIELLQLVAEIERTWGWVRSYTNAPRIFYLFLE